MRAIPSFGSERTYNASRAIILYEPSDHRGSDDNGTQAATCGATIHRIETFGGKPQLQPGSPVTLPALEALCAALSRQTKPVLIHERTLAITMSRMLWWCPGARRRIWFNPADTKTTGLKLKKVNGKVVSHPPLVFLAGHGELSVFALGSNERPNIETPLFLAPYFNLSPAGLMCAGTVNVPAIATPALLPRFETAFFGSSFSHSNWGHKLTRHSTGHLGLWQEMVKAKSFPTRYLVPTKTTLESLLK